MTRKDYRIIAEAIAEARGDTNYQNAISLVARYIAMALKRDNPRFDHERFMAATYKDRNHDPDYHTPNQLNA